MIRPLAILLLLTSTAIAGQPDIEDRRDNDTSMQVPYTDEKYRIRRVFIRKDTPPANDQRETGWATMGACKWNCPDEPQWPWTPWKAPK